MSLSKESDVSALYLEYVSSNFFLGGRAFSFRKFKRCV